MRRDYHGLTERGGGLLAIAIFSLLSPVERGLAHHGAAAHYDLEDLVTSRLLAVYIKCRRGC